MIRHALHKPDSPCKVRISRDHWLELLFQVPARDLSGAAKIAGAAVAMHISPETGLCQLSREAIADRCGMDSRSCRRMIKHLENAGWLGVRRSVGLVPNSFELRIPAEPDAVTSVGGRASV